jgi:hypothetical protein
LQKPTETHKKLKKELYNTAVASKKINPTFKIIIVTGAFFIVLSFGSLSKWVYLTIVLILLKRSY